MPFGFLGLKFSKPGSLSRGVSNPRKNNRSGLVGNGSSRVGESGRLVELSDDPPPAYTQYQEGFNPTQERVRKTTRISTGNKGIEDDPYGFLTDFDTVFLIDDSGSMRGRLWKEVEAALQVIVPICTARDVDGVDFYFLNNKDHRRFRNVTNPDLVAQIFHSVRPYALTPTGQRLNDVMKPYIKALQTCQEQGAELPKPLNIIVITDGKPSDKPEDFIVQAAKMLDALDAPAWQIGIQFFQVGGDKDAANSLTELDDGLKDRYGIRDMVDTVPFKADLILDVKFILKVVTGAINRRLDRYSV